MKHGGPKINNDGTLDSLLKLLKERTADSNEGPVVWTHAGSELLIRNQDITVKAADNILHVYVPVESDQTGLQIVTLRYYLGNEQQMERMAVADKSLMLLKSLQRTGVLFFRNPFGALFFNGLMQIRLLESLLKDLLWIPTVRF